MKIQKVNKKNKKRQYRRNRILNRSDRKCLEGSRRIRWSIRSKLKGIKKASSTNPHFKRKKKRKDLLQ